MISPQAMLIHLAEYRGDRPTFALASVASLATSSLASHIVPSSPSPMYHMRITWSIGDNGGSLVRVVLSVAHEGLLERSV